MKKQIVVLYPSEFMKSTKYKRRWRGPDGKWRYDYGSDDKAKWGPSSKEDQKKFSSKKVPQKKPVLNPKVMEDMSASDKVKYGASVVSGKNLPKVDSYNDIPVPPKVNAKDRRALSNAVHDAAPGDYFKDIPIDEIDSALREEGYLLIQEDGTAWAGMLTGTDGEATFRLGKLSEGRELNGEATYKPVPNSGLRMTWHQMRPGRWEVIKYIT